jgi:hypothetical protein
VCVAACSVVWRMVTLLWGFVRYRHGRLRVFNRELPAVQHPFCRRRPCCVCCTSAAQADGPDDIHRTWPLCCLPCEMFPSVEGMLKVFLWSALFLVAALFYGGCVGESRSWFAPGCPPAEDSDSSNFDVASVTYGGAPWSCWDAADVLSQSLNPPAINCSAPIDPSAPSGIDMIPRGRLSFCFRYYEQTPDAYVNTASICAAFLNFILGAVVSFIASRLHAAPNPNVVEM